MGILKNDIVDRERGLELDLARNEDILDDCSKESRGMLNYANKAIATTTTREKRYAFSLNYLFSLSIQIKRICVCVLISLSDVLPFGI